MQPAHRIRLRGGWSYVSLPGSSDESRRVVLPLAWPDVAGRSFRAERVFQAPPLDPASELLFLHLEHVPGLRTVALNGEMIAALSGEEHSLVLRLVPVNRRSNRLVLEVGPVPSSAGADAIWGSIALVISLRPPDTADSDLPGTAEPGAAPA